MATGSVYAGRRVCLTTLHGKERVLARPFFHGLGAELVVCGCDTDQLGTFSGEIERAADPLSTCVRKAALGLEASGLRLGLASEGSFGPHPSRGSCPLCPGNSAWGTSSRPSVTNPCCNHISSGGHFGFEGYTPGMFARDMVRIAFKKVGDGLSKTILLGETLPYETVHNGVYLSGTMTVLTNTPVNTFALPEELVADGKHNGPVGNASDHRINGIKSKHPGGAMVAMCDGSVRFLQETIAMPVLWAMGTRDLGGLDVVPVNQ